MRKAFEPELPLDPLSRNGIFAVFLILWSAVMNGDGFGTKAPGVIVKMIKGC